MAQGRADVPQAGGTPWRDLRVRFISAAILAPLCLFILWWGGVAWTVLILVFGAGMAVEWVTMSRVSRQGRLSAISLLLGVCYILPAVAALIWLRGAAGTGRANVMFVVLVVWASDIGAYLAGRWLGGPKLAPSVSPGKTWSGAVGGLVFACFVGGGAALLWQAALPPGLLVACALGLVSQAGDLLESAVKRHFGVKDSGRLIPGHGGLLDRLDGVLAAAPTAALLALAMGQGRVLWQ